MADQRTTDLEPIAALPNNGVLDVVDVDDTSEDPAGTSKKITKANFLKEVVADVLANTAKVGITTNQAAAILLNTAKVGISTDQAAAILLNTAKAGITTGQAAAILLNTAKVGITPAQATAITDNTANTSKVSINTDAASITNVRSLRYREETYSSNLDMVMQSSVGVYAWVNIFTIAFNVVNSLVTRFKNRVATDSGTFENQTALETFLGTITSTLSTVLAAITPNAFKASKLYSVIPNTSALDATVIRNTTATRINSAGLIEIVAANIARITYLTVGGEGFILDEPQATNLKTFSESILATNQYNVVQSTLTAVSITNPAGGTSNNILILNSGTTTGDTSVGFNFSSSLSLAINTQHTQSLFVKPAGATVLRLRNNFVGGTTDFILTGSGTTAPAVNGITASTITALTNGYYRVTFTYTTGTTGAAIRGDFFSIKTNVADGVSGVYVYGAQLELGGVATSYIPTTSAAVTRNADVITLAPPTGTVKITTTFSNNSTQVLTTIPSTYTMPEGLIKSVNFNNTL